MIDNGVISKMMLTSLPPPHQVWIGINWFNIQLNCDMKIRVFNPSAPLPIIFVKGTMVHSTGTSKASKSEALDLCQLPCPPYEIHKMIYMYLPVSVKVFKNKLKTEKLINPIFTSLIRHRKMIN